LIGTRRGFFKLTKRGKQILSQNPEKINARFLYQFSEFKDFTKVERFTNDNIKEIKP